MVAVMFKVPTYLNSTVAFPSIAVAVVVHPKGATEDTYSSSTGKVSVTTGFIISSLSLFTVIFHLRLTFLCCLIVLYST